jgi:exonuclease V gamma subunit
MQVGYSKYKPQRLLKPWLDLMALVAHDPGTEWQSVLLNREKSGKGVDIEIMRPRGDDPETRQAHARGALTVAVDCYRRGRREPIPLFYEFSRCVFDGNPKPGDWKNERMRFGDGYDVANHVVYGDLDFHALLALPALDTDPPGPAKGRVERFAEFLWGAMRDSTDLITGPENDE